jgi:hypothetical protein
MRIFADGSSSYIQVGNGDPGSTGNVEFAPYFDGTGRVVINTGSGNINAGNVLTAGRVSAAGNVVGAGLVINGNAVISGNATIQGNLTYNNITNLTTANLVLGLGNNQTGINVTGGGMVVGNTNEARWLYNQPTQTWNSNLGISATGNITGNFFVGNGSLLTGLPPAYGNANVTNLLSSGNISSNVITTGNVTGGNISTSGNINFSAPASFTDSARISANVSSNVTTFIMEVSDDLEDKIVLRHNYYGTGNTVDMLSAQLVSDTQANVTVTGNLIATNQVRATNIGNVAAVNLNGNSVFYLSGTGTWGRPGPESVTSNITFSASGSAPTKATTSQSDWITLQDDKTGWCTLQFQYAATNPSGAASGSGIYYIALPSGYRFDTAFHRTDTSTTGTVDPQMATKIIAGSTGLVSWGTGSVPVSGTVAIIPVSDSSFKMITPQGIGGSGASNWSVVSSGYFNLNGGGGNYALAASFRFKKAD